MTSLSPAGKLTTFTGLPAGAWFGEGSLLKDEPRKYDVVALRDSRVALMPRATFDWLLDSSIAFNRFLLLQLNERLSASSSASSSTTGCWTSRRASRAASPRCSIRTSTPEPAAQLAISQEEIGYLSGVSRQRVNQALKTLERAGLLTVGVRRDRRPRPSRDCAISAPDMMSANASPGIRRTRSPAPLPPPRRWRCQRSHRRRRR